MILQNRRVTVDEVARQLQLSHGAAYEITQNRLAFHKVLYDGTQSSPWNCTKTSADVFRIAMVLKVTIS
jgi:hypothetical protein